MSTDLGRRWTDRAEFGPGQTGFLLEMVDLAFRPEHLLKLPAAEWAQVLAAGCAAGACPPARRTETTAPSETQELGLQGSGFDSSRLTARAPDGCDRPAVAPKEKLVSWGFDAFAATDECLRPSARWNWTSPDRSGYAAVALSESELLAQHRLPAAQHRFPINGLTARACHLLAEVLRPKKQPDDDPMRRSSL